MRCHGPSLDLVSTKNCSIAEFSATEFSLPSFPHLLSFIIMQSPSLVQLNAYRELESSLIFSTTNSSSLPCPLPFAWPNNPTTTSSYKSTQGLLHASSLPSTLYWSSSPVLISSLFSAQDFVISLNHKIFFLRLTTSFLSFSFSPHSTH